ncbi:MAG: Nif3-like dinuclear metal center hexameric protein [Candidatus Helarchaeota archaeon]
MTDLYEFIQILRRITDSPISIEDFDDCLITGSSYVSKQKRRKIKKVIITPDLTKKAVIGALKNKVDLILIFNYEKWERSLVDENFDLIKHIIENNIIVYKIPDNWAYSEGGLNDTIAEILKLEIEGVFNIKIGEKLLPYGRICSPFKSQINFSYFLNLVSDKLGIPHFQYILVNKSENIIKKCILLLGKNTKREWLKRAKMKEIDLFLGQGLTYSLARYAETLDINFIDLSSSSIYYGLSRLSNVFSIECPDIEFFEIDSRIPLSFFLG